MIDEHTKVVGDMVAYAWAGAATFAWWTQLIGQLTPIFSFVLLSLAIVWQVWRMVDRVRFGPRKD